MDEKDVIDFKDHGTFIDKDLMACLSVEISRYLNEWNVRNTSSVGDNFGAFGGVHLCQLVVSLCHRLKQPPSVVFRSLDLFERFMERHMLDLYQHVVVNFAECQRCVEWRHLVSRVANQVILRLTSCMQIASKLTLHYHIITTKKVRLILAEAGHSYSLESVVNSELRVLRTLDYKVSEPTCLDFVECLLSRLVCDCDAKCERLDYAIDRMTAADDKDGGSLWCRLLQTATLLLRWACVHRTRLYTRLFTVTGGSGGDEFGAAVTNARRRIFNSVCADREALAAVVLAAAAALQMPAAAAADQLLKELAAVTAVDIEDLLNFGEVLLRDVFSMSS